MSNTFDPGLLYSPGFTATSYNQFIQNNSSVAYRSQSATLHSITSVYTQLELPVVDPRLSNLGVAYNNQTNLGQFILGEIGGYDIFAELIFLVSGQRSSVSPNRMTVNLQVNVSDASGNLIKTGNNEVTIVNGPIGGGTDRYQIQARYVFSTLTTGFRVVLTTASFNAPGLIINTAPGNDNLSSILINYTGVDRV